MEILQKKFMYIRLTPGGTTTTWRSHLADYEERARVHKWLRNLIGVRRISRAANCSNLVDGYAPVGTLGSVNAIWCRECRSRIASRADFFIYKLLAYGEARFLFQNLIFKIIVDNDIKFIWEQLTTGWMWLFENRTIESRTFRWTSEFKQITNFKFRNCCILTKIQIYFPLFEIIL